MRTIAHISDLHFDKVDRHVAEALVADLHEINPSLVVVSGDLTQRARRGQFRRAAELLARLPKPQIVLPGNHDVPLWNFAYRAFAPLRHYRRFISDDLAPAYCDEEMIVVGVNTARRGSLRPRGFWKDGAISDEQIERTRRAFDPAGSPQFKIVITHHPFLAPIPEFAGDIIGNAGAALDAFASAGVDLLLSGHLHMTYCADVREQHADATRSMISIQAGSATSTRIREPANSYNRITLDRDRIEIAVRRWNRSQFAASDLLRYVRYDRGWKLADGS